MASWALSPAQHASEDVPQEASAPHPQSPSGRDLLPTGLQVALPDLSVGAGVPLPWATHPGYVQKHPGKLSLALVMRGR